MAGSAGMTTPAPRALRRFGLIAAPIAAVIDQATKAWALEALWPPYSEGITLLPVLNLRLGFNTGVTFGMFADSAAGAVWLLVGIKLAVVAWLLHWLGHRLHRRALRRLALADLQHGRCRHRLRRHAAGAD